MITVLMAVHNGAATLPDTLSSLCVMEPPADGWELVVVNNASSDDTADILQGFAKRLPMRIIEEPVAGKNTALNTALPHCRGELLVFMDDDVVVSREWLQAMAQCSAAYPEADIIAGRITARWPDPRAAHRVRLVPEGPAYGIHPAAIPDGPVGAHMAWGANLAIRASVFDRGYRFDPLLGPRPGDYIQGGEIGLTLRLEKAGSRTVFSNRAAVEHQILPEQLHWAWLAGRGRRYGRQEYLLANEVPEGRRLWGYLRWKFPYLSAAYLMCLLQLLLLRPAHARASLWEASTLLGWLQEDRRRYSDPAC